MMPIEIRRCAHCKKPSVSKVSFLHSHVMNQVVKEVLEKTEVGKLELNFSYDAHASVLKVGVNQAVILMPRSKNYPNSYITG